MMLINNRGIINGKTGKAATLPKFSDTLILFQPRGADCAHPLALLSLTNSMITPLNKYFNAVDIEGIWFKAALVGCKSQNLGSVFCKMVGS